MQAQFRKSLIAWSIIIAVILLLVGAIVYRSISALITDTGRVAHTHVVIGTLLDTLSLLQDVQGSQRGYVITGQDIYLDPYRAALPRIKSNLEKLKVLTADNPKQQQRLISLRSNIKMRLALAQTIIETRRTKGFDAAQRLVLSGEGKREMDIIRSRVARMESEERHLLQQRSKNAQAATRFAIGAGAGGLMIAVSIIYIILSLVRRESLRRMEVEAGLETTNSKLQESLTAMESLTREMMITGSVAELLQSCRTLEEAYDVIHKKLPQALPDVRATLALLNNSANYLEVVLQLPPGQSMPGPFSPNDCWGLRRGQTYLAHDLRSDVLCPHIERDSNYKTEENNDPHGTTLCLPLVAHGEILGVLTLMADQPDAFTEACRRVALTMAEHISLALTNLKLQESLRIQSIRDPLSGLFNRRYLEESFEREIARATRHKHALSVAMIDIDFFKRFNDTYGHEAGDLLLKEFGAFLASHSRGEDVACRYGGEEFTLLLPDASLEVALKRVEELRVGAAQIKIEYRHQPLPGITLSAGVATFPTHGSTREDLLRVADASLYRAKQEGRNRVVAAELPTK